MKSYNNKYLMLEQDVVLSPVIDKVISSLDQFFKDANLKAKVTSGIRDEYKQLGIIKSYAERNGLTKSYPKLQSIKNPYDKDKDGNYVWQMAWSHLLNIGVIINPPLRAICLMDYINTSGTNRKGQYINQTPHVTGKCFDIGGDKDGVDNELNVIKKAMEAKLPGLVGYVLERKNNCLHIDCI